MKRILFLIRDGSAACLFLCFFLIACATGAPVVENAAVGNVTTTAAFLCWESNEAARPSLRIFSDAAGNNDISSEVIIDYQFLRADRREVASTLETRARARTIQTAMNNRWVYLARVSGLQPDTDYWLQAVVADPSTGAEEVGAILPLTTAARSSFILESRQLLIDLSGAGDLTGTVVSLSNPNSPYPLFSVVGDGLPGSRVYFDLTNFLDGAGETQLRPASGTNLELTVGLKGGELGPGDLNGSEIAFTGTPTAALASTATFVADALILVANPAQPIALAGHPFVVDFRAENAGGDVLTDFDRALTLSSPALAGGTLETDPLSGGVLVDQAVTLMNPGEQTVEVTDPATGANSSFDVEVLPYSYDNYRTYYFGNLTDPEGDLLGNPDLDEFTNLEEFAYGLNPGARDSAMVLGPGFSIINRGGPVTSLRIDSNGVDFRVTFLRPVDHETLGISYTPRFSPDLSQWFDASGPPTVVATDGGMELVTYQYPFFTPDARKARFFTISVNIP